MPEEEGRHTINARCMVGGEGAEGAYYAREGCTCVIKSSGD